MDSRDPTVCPLWLGLKEAESFYERVGCFGHAENCCWVVQCSPARFFPNSDGVYLTALVVGLSVHDSVGVYDIRGTLLGSLL